MSDTDSPVDALSRAPASATTPKPPASRLTDRGAIGEKQKRVMSIIADAKKKNT